MGANRGLPQAQQLDAGSLACQHDLAVFQQHHTGPQQFFPQAAVGVDAPFVVARHIIHRRHAHGAPHELHGGGDVGPVAIHQVAGDHDAIRRLLADGLQQFVLLLAKPFVVQVRHLQDGEPFKGGCQFIAAAAVVAHCDPVVLPSAQRR